VGSQDVRIAFQSFAPPPPYETLNHCLATPSPVADTYSLYPRSLHYANLPLRPDHGTEWLPDTFEGASVVHTLLTLPGAQSTVPARAEPFSNLYGSQDANRGWIRTVSDQHSASASPVYSAPNSSFSDYPVTLQSGTSRSQAPAAVEHAVASADYAAEETGYSGSGQLPIHPQVPRQQLLSPPNLSALESLPSSTRILPVPPVIRSQYSMPPSLHDIGQRTNSLSSPNIPHGISSAPLSFRPGPRWQHDIHSVGGLGNRDNPVYGQAQDQIHASSKTQPSPIEQQPDCGPGEYMTAPEDISAGSPIAAPGRKPVHAYRLATRPQLSLKFPRAVSRNQDQVSEPTPNYTYSSGSGKRSALGQYDSNGTLVNGRPYGELAPNPEPTSSTAIAEHQPQILSHSDSASGLMHLRHAPFKK
jgi:hypothetical protein